MFFFLGCSLIWIILVFLSEVKISNMDIVVIGFFKETDFAFMSTSVFFVITS